MTMTCEGPPHISVIVPVLNESAQIQTTLNDFIPLRKAGHEVIVVDGGSQDTTLEIATPLADKVIQSPKGRAFQMNAGAAAVSGNLLWFVHADTRIPRNAACILIQASGLRGWGRFDIRLSGRHPLLRLVEGMMCLRSRLTGIATGDQGIFVSRVLFERVGGYPEIPLMEDIALSKALRRIQRPICLKHRLVTSSRRWEKNGIVKTILLMWRFRLAYFLGADPADLEKRYS